MKPNDIALGALLGACWVYLDMDGGSGNGRDCQK